MSRRRSWSGPGGVAATVSRNRRRERWAAWTICRHGSLTVNGSTAVTFGARGTASSTDPA